MLVRKKGTTDIYAMKVLKKEAVIRRNQVAHTKTETHILKQIRHPFLTRMFFGASPPRRRRRASQARHALRARARVVRWEASCVREVDLSLRSLPAGRSRRAPCSFPERGQAVHGAQLPPRRRALLPAQARGPLLARARQAVHSRDRSRLGCAHMRTPADGACRWRTPMAHADGARPVCPDRKAWRPCVRGHPAPFFAAVRHGPTASAWRARVQGTCIRSTSSIATSSPRTSCWMRSATSASPILGSRRRWSPLRTRRAPSAARPSISLPRSCRAWATARPWTGGRSARSSSRCSPDSRPSTHATSTPWSVAPLAAREPRVAPAGARSFSSPVP